MDPVSRLLSALYSSSVNMIFFLSPNCTNLFMSKGNNHSKIMTVTTNQRSVLTWGKQLLLCLWVKKDSLADDLLTNQRLVNIVSTNQTITRSLVSAASFFLPGLFCFLTWLYEDTPMTVPPPRSNKYFPLDLLTNQRLVNIVATNQRRVFTSWCWFLTGLCLAGPQCCRSWEIRCPRLVSRCLGNIDQSETSIMWVNQSEAGSLWINQLQVIIYLDRTDPWRMFYQVQWQEQYQQRSDCCEDLRPCVEPSEPGLSWQREVEDCLSGLSRFFFQPCLCKTRTPPDQSGVSIIFHPPIRIKYSPDTSTVPREDWHHPCLRTCTDHQMSPCQYLRQ